MKKFILPVLITLATTLFFLPACSSDTNDEEKSAEVSTEISYTFYYSHASTSPLYTISGNKGDRIPTIPRPKRTFYTFSSWECDDSTTLPETFGEKNLDFYAKWTNSTQIGSKIKPSTVGDIVFTDGSATPFTEVIATPLTDAQKEHVAAIIYTTTYNPQNGDNKNGKTMLGIAVHPKHTNWCAQTIKVGDTKVLLSLYAGYDIQSVYSNSQPAQALSFNAYDGSKNLVPTEQFLAYSYWYAPAFYYAYTYGTKAIEMCESLQSGWYLPSLYELRVLMKDEEVRSTIVAIFNLLGIDDVQLDMNGSATKGKAQSTLMLTSYADSSDPDDVEAEDWGGKYNKKKMWVSLRLYDITAEQKLRDKTPLVNPKDDYEHAAIYWRACAYDLSGNETFVKKHAKGFDEDSNIDNDDDAIKKCYAFPVRVFK